MAFYAWANDLSAGYTTHTQGPRSPLPHDELDGLSAAEVFWAVTPEGDEVPGILVEHQEALHENDGFRSWPEVTAASAQGWARDWPTQRSLPECNNSTFNSNWCALIGSWVGKYCQNDSNGSFSLDNYGTGSHGTLRYQAAVCFDSANGYLHDYLYWSSECSGQQGYGIIWFHAVPYGNEIYPEAFLSWTWIAPSSFGGERRWLHAGSASGGAYRDWASRYGADTACYP